MRAGIVDGVFIQTIICRKTGNAIGITKENKTLKIFVLTNTKEEIKETMGVEFKKCKGTDCYCELIPHIS